MDGVLEHDELDAAGALVEFGRLRQVRDDADREILLLAAHFADLHNASSLPGAPTPAFPGLERAVRLAGDGTPMVEEFAVAEMALELHLSTFAAKRLLGDALELRHRLPLLWSRLECGDVVAWRARKVAQATRDLTLGQAGFVDAEIVDHADSRLPAGRFLTILEGLLVAADPEGAAEAERKAAAERFAKVGRSNEHGQKTLYVKTSAAEMIRIDATVAYLAEVLATLGDEGGIDDRRTKAMLILANPVQALTLLQAFSTHGNQRAQSPSGNAYDEQDAPLPEDERPAESRPAGDRPADDPLPPFFRRFHPDDVPPCTCQGGQWAWDAGTTQKLLPTVTMYLHMHRDTLDADDGSDDGSDDGWGVVRWEGEGPVTAAYVRDFLGPHARFDIRPVIDLADQAPADAYEVRGRRREAVRLRSPADFFPWGPCTSRKMDAEHTVPYRPPDEGGPPGQSSTDNLGFTTRFHHRIKTHAPGWTVRQPFPGVYLWRAPHGAITLVDHTGTRMVRDTAQARRLLAEDQTGATQAAPVARVELFFRETLAEYAVA